MSVSPRRTIAAEIVVVVDDCDCFCDGAVVVHCAVDADHYDVVGGGDVVFVEMNRRLLQRKSLSAGLLPRLSHIRSKLLLLWVPWLFEFLGYFWRLTAGRRISLFRGFRCNVKLEREGEKEPLLLLVDSLADVLLFALGRDVRGGLCRDGRYFDGRDVVEVRKFVLRVNQGS